MTFGRVSIDAPIASVDRALAVLEQLTQYGPDGEALGVLASDLGVSKAGLHHTLSALRHRGWVDQTANGNYVLGAATGQLAQWWTSAQSVVRLLHPVLLGISQDSKELVHLGQLSGSNVVYLDKVEPDRPIRVWSEVGRTIPAVLTAMGRAILGTMRAMDHVDVDPWLHSVNTGTRRGLTERVKTEFKRVALDGYACEIEENEPGLACVAVPVSVVGNQTMAISITAPVERMGSDRVRALAALISRSVNQANVTNVSATSVSSGNRPA